MMKAAQDIRPIKKGAEEDILKRPGVTGMDIGCKFVKGKKTEELAIRVYVAEKKDVPKSQLIPGKIKGIKTDVIARKFVLHPARVQLADLEVKADTGNYDPLRGGISIGPCRSVWLEPPDVDTPGWYVFVGTLGAVVRDGETDDEMFLSNFHVMCVDDQWSVGDDMCQPSLVDEGNCPADVIGQLQRASLGGTVDCAVCSHTARGFACNIVDIGDVAGTAAASEGMAVRKRGRTTGLTYGTVDSVDLSVILDYGNGLGSVVLTDQIGIDADTAHNASFGTNGDSGSVVVNDDCRVVGLYFAGSEDGSHGVANPIQDVLDALNVNICVPKAVEVKDLKWEKLEWKEHFKIEKPELKEYKERLKQEKWEKHEWKEHFKLEKLELPELAKSEWAEIGAKVPSELDPKSLVEGGLPNIPWQPIDPGGPAPPIGRMPPGLLEQRMSQLEATVGQLAHFINPSLRPDLSRGALSREPDQSPSAGLSQKLQKDASDAKNAKDNKDTEKASEC